ncbi:hypothetical protein GCM10027321_40040 [Massilia terrae]|uniref:GNAT family N-acetyltransferase n=1 Tax=Massilia terrae TaxID=1811224 RepID=A0ABT2D4I7_9BURK|nr:GNAT family N-acetyltransferase [Massilia terrae]MCS0661155.1 GNAT family N-acetyltransferase [Massilia terrae]
MDWAVRPAAPDDAAFLANLFRSTRPELAMLPDGLAGMLIAQQQHSQDLGYRQAFPHAQTLVIEAGGEPAGKLVLDEQRQQLRVVDLAVAPPFRGRGLATAVLRQLHQAGRDLVLSVAHDNLAAIRLYHALGFEEESRDEVRAEMRWRAQ